ncbi:rubredoxin [Rhodococcus sp. 06-621-2]|nr:rubredoxin [Rhodococcus sp. 06-621-2]OZC58711.1 rubredoxin [Rhodococcus sp. 06-621-2]
MTAYECPVCNYVYDEAAGAPREGFPAGTPWSDCGVREKIDFEQKAG